MRPLMLLSILYMTVCVNSGTYSDERNGKSTINLIGMEPVATEIREKRLSLRSNDPLTRRSSLEKNFIRFGRSGGGRVARFLRNQDFETTRITLPDFTVRDVRRQHDNFMRLGRGLRNGNYENSTNYGGTIEADNWLDDENSEPRLSPFLANSRRAARENFMRLGRYGNRQTRRHDNFMRLGRNGKANIVPRQTDTLSRYIRKQENFMRFGREYHQRTEPAKNYLARYVRGRHDNFMRLGRRDSRKKRHAYYFDDDVDSERNDGKQVATGFFGLFDRYRRKQHDNFMRLGRIDAEPVTVENISNIEADANTIDDRPTPVNDAADYDFDELKRNPLIIELLSANKSGTNYDRLRRKHDNFMRLGRSNGTSGDDKYNDRIRINANGEIEFDLEQPDEETSDVDVNELSRAYSKRSLRRKQNRNTFIRYGRDAVAGAGRLIILSGFVPEKDGRVTYLREIRYKVGNDENDGILSGQLNNGDDPDAGVLYGKYDGPSDAGVKVFSCVLNGNRKEKIFFCRNDPEYTFLKKPMNLSPSSSSPRYLTIILEPNADRKNDLRYKRSAIPMKTDANSANEKNLETNLNCSKTIDKSFTGKILKNFNFNPFSLKGFMSFLVPDAEDIVTAAKQREK